MDNTKQDRGRPLVLTNVYDFAKIEDPSIFAKVGNVSLTIAIRGPYMETHEMAERIMGWLKAQAEHDAADCDCDECRAGRGR